MTFYILKIRGTAKIPDYIQLRGEDYTLKAYFRADRPEKHLVKAGLGDFQDQIMEIVQTLTYGKVEKITL